MSRLRIAALILALLPLPAAAQRWSSISVITDAQGAQQLIVRDADGRNPRRIAVSNLVPNAITGASISGSTLTLTFADGTTSTATLPTGGGEGGGGSADGVITGASFAADGSNFTITRSVGANIVVTVPAALRTPPIGANSITAAQARATSTAHRREWQNRLSIPDDWSEIANGTAIALGKVVEHGGGYYGAITAHSKSSTGPDGDAANWVLLSNYRGAWVDAWYPVGSFVTHSGLPYIATAAVVRGNPQPNAAANTKWLQLGASPIAVVIASSNTSIPASANGNTYVHTGSSNITYTLPAASGGGAVDNGWQVVVTNQGAGDLTIDGNGADTVDGAATLVITDNGRSVRLQKIANSAWATIADTKDDVGTASSGLNQAQVDARIAALVNDDRILDLAKASRVTGDRGKFLGVSASNENDMTLLDAPSGGGSARAFGSGSGQIATWGRGRQHRRRASGEAAGHPEDRNDEPVH